MTDAVAVPADSEAKPHQTYKVGVRRKTRQINVGGVPVGGDAPISVQTMTKTKTDDVAGTVGQIVAAADAYVSDFGTFKVIPSRFNRDRTLCVLDMDFWSVAYLRPFQQTALAKVGDSDKRMILAEYGLKSLNQAASGKVADCTTS